MVRSLYSCSNDHYIYAQSWYLVSCKSRILQISPGAHDPLTAVDRSAHMSQLGPTSTAAVSALKDLDHATTVTVKYRSDR